MLLTLSVVYFKPILILLNFALYSLNYYLLANSFNKKIFAHVDGKFVYRNVFRRRLSFNIDEIQSIKQTRIRRGMMIQLKDGKGFVYLTPYWKNWQQLFRFILNRVDPAVVQNKEKLMAAFDL